MIEVCNVDLLSQTKFSNVMNEYIGEIETELENMFIRGPGWVRIMKKTEVQSFVTLAHSLVALASGSGKTMVSDLKTMVSDLKTMLSDLKTMVSDLKTMVSDLKSSSFVIRTSWQKLIVFRIQKTAEKIQPPGYYCCIRRRKKLRARRLYQNVIMIYT